MKRRKQMTKSVYISGAGGMLGDAVFNHFQKQWNIRATDINVCERWLTYLDVRDYDAYRKDVKSFTPDLLIHLAALTDLEYCETHTLEAYNTNTKSVENAVIIARELSIPLVYVSTAGIFDGSKEMYDDWDVPNPINHYGRSKFLGEKYVVENSEKYYVFRAGWMMGGGPTKDKKFIFKILKQIMQGRETLYIVNDKLGIPTYTHDFARGIEKMCSTPFYGVYNMVCEGSASRVEIAKEILTILGLTDKIKIVEVDSDFFQSEYFAPRPSSEQLLNIKLKMRNIRVTYDWRERLEQYIIAYFCNPHSRKLRIE